MINMSQMRKSALSAGNLSIELESFAVPSEVESLLEELLPHAGDVSVARKDGAVPYSAIRRVRLDNGIKAVRLPNGRLLAKSLDRKLGKPFWVIVRG